jgi:hypothetical protein
VCALSVLLSKHHNTRPMFDFIGFLYAATQEAGAMSGKQTFCLCVCVGLGVHESLTSPEHLGCALFFAVATMRPVLEHCIFEDFACLPRLCVGGHINTECAHSHTCEAMHVCVCLNKVYAHFHSCESMHVCEQCMHEQRIAHTIRLCARIRCMLTVIAARRCMYVRTCGHQCMYVCMHVHEQGVCLHCHSCEVMHV